MSAFEQTCEAMLDDGSLCGKPALEQWNHRASPDQDFKVGYGWVLCRFHVYQVLRAIFPAAVAQAGIQALDALNDQVDLIHKAMNNGGR